MPYYLAPLWDVHFSHVADHNSARKNAAKAASRKNRVPKDLRERLRHTRAARGMLQDLEDEIRLFIRNWNEKQLILETESLQDSSDASVTGDSEDEIVFVGRKGQMRDSSERKNKVRQFRDELYSHCEHDGAKMVFESLVDDRAASFG